MSPTKSNSWMLFLPAICVYPLWITIGLRDGIITTAVSSFYPMMIAMVLGSMIAGATPLGGGVVGFPVSVLILGFSPEQGRDFSLLIQSIGMTAASFLILYDKHTLLRGHEKFVSKSIVISLVGLILGFELLGGLSPFVVNIVYTTTVASIALVLAYRSFCERLNPRTANDVPLRLNSGDSESGSFCDSPSEGKKRNGERVTSILLECICFPLLSIVGGVLSSQIGSGADIMCFIGGCIINTRISRDNCCDNTLTAASVIVMACISVFGSVLRLTTGEQAESVGTEVLLAVFACSPVVVLGAPAGSLFLTPAHKVRLKVIFCVLGMLQLILFGAIKIGRNKLAWAVVSAVIFIILGVLVTHHVVGNRGHSNKGNKTDVSGRDSVTHNQ